MVDEFGNGEGGYSAAIAVVMLLLIIPIMVFNIRRFRSERVTGSVATADATVARPRETPSARVLGFVTRTPVHLGLIVIAIIWLVPTVGLSVTSLRPRGEIQSSSWWSSLTHPDFTLENYTDVLNRGNMDTAFVNSLIITIPATLLPLALAALAAYGSPGSPSRSATRSSCSSSR